MAPGVLVVWLLAISASSRVPGLRGFVSLGVQHAGVLVPLWVQGLGILLLVVICLAGVYPAGD